MEISPVLAQTMAEYGLLQAIAAGFSKLEYRVETFVRAGNNRNILLGAAIILFVLLVWRRR
jgi:hypothetical protein